jgi:hypothetical protein
MAAGASRPTIDEIRIGDDPATWRAVGFTVDDDGVARVGHTRLRLAGRQEGPRIRGWTLRDLASDAAPAGDLDGLPTGLSTAEEPEPADHPLGALRIDHVVVASPDRARTTAALEAAGLVARRVRRTESYGAPMSQTFFRAGEVIIELVCPEPDEHPGPPQQNPNQPAAFFGLAITVADLETAAERLGPGLGAIKPAVQAGRRIATLRHRDLGLSVATALMSPEPD